MQEQKADKAKRQLKIMSFNLRYENDDKDTGLKHWSLRKENCLNLIKICQPDILGVQQMRDSQKQYLQENLKVNYEYYGKPRDQKKGEGCGIFYRRQILLAEEKDVIWINEKRKPGVAGFGARLQRIYTKIKFKYLPQPELSLFVINSHFDHESEEAKKMGIVMSCEEFEKQKGSNCVFMADTNISQNDKRLQIFKENGLSNIKLELQSKKSLNCDEGATFNHWKFPKKGKLDQRFTIDHMFYRAGTGKLTIEPSAYKIIREQDKIASDHFPILGEFMIHQ